MRDSAPRVLQRWRRRLPVLACIALLGASAALAQADSDAPPPCGSDVPKRPVPDYDGRGPPPTTLGDALVWIPRILLVPAYLVTEYAIRLPIGGADTYAEQNHWPSSIYNFFTFGPDHQFGIFPTFLIDFNVRPSVGVHFFWNGAFTPGNLLTSDVGYGGPQWLRVAVADRYAFSKSEAITVEAQWNRRPDTLYYGTGSDVTNALISRVGSDVITGTVNYDKVVDKFITLQATGAIKR